MTTTAPAPTTEATVRDLRELPKGHLHLHMEAAMRPETLIQLADGLGIPAPDMSTYSGFTQFSKVYRTLLAVLREPAALELLVNQIFDDQAAQGVFYLELGVNSTFYCQVYGSDEAALKVVVALARSAAARHGMGFGIMASIDRTAPVERSIEIATAAASLAGQGVVSLGLASDERGFPCASFTEAFAIAKSAGLRATPHAGELVGPESVWEAIDVLHADRVQHGVRAIEDPALILALSERGIVLDVCPTSNVLLDVVPDISSHPLPALLAANVRCSINADDPIIFGPDILAEYELCRNTLGLTDAQLAECAWNSIEATAAPAELKTEARKRIDDWLS